MTAPVQAAANLTISPITWDIIGLDSNKPDPPDNQGPENFPVGARVCNTGDATANNLVSNFVWDNTPVPSYINSRPGTLTTLTLSSLAAGACTDFYYEVEVDRDTAAWDTTREYHIDVDSDETALISTPAGRQLYVEHLISQNRNGIYDIKLDGVSIPPGGDMTLVVGQTYDITLDGFTAPGGYNQFEAFINFKNTVFQIQSVSTTYASNSSGLVDGGAEPATTDMLYADACGWMSNPLSPYYRNCVVNSLWKTGGDPVSTVYTIKIIGGAGTSEMLNTLLYDFSGSSYHYNSDFSTGFRIANIIDPADFPIAKSFTPNSIYVNGISTLKITLTNPTNTAVSGFNFTDPLPANVVVANPPSASTSGCGSPTFAPAANDTSLTFGDPTRATIGANGTCTITVNVTSDGTGSPYTNTTNNLFLDAIDTGNNAQAGLTVSGTPPPGSGCPTTNQTLAQWTFTGQDGVVPPNLTPSTLNVASAVISNGNGTTVIGDAGDGNPAPALETYGWPGSIVVGSRNPSTNPYVGFAIDTTGASAVMLTFDARATTPGPNTYDLYYSTDGATFTLLGANDHALTTSYVAQGAYDFTGLTNVGGVTYFRLYGYGANNDNQGWDMYLDNVTFTGTATGTCTPATIAKAFSPNPIGEGQTSTLTITLTNPNSIDLTNATFTDALPSGVVVAATPNDSTTCVGGAITSDGVNPLAGGESTIEFDGGTIPATGSCTVQVDVTSATAGSYPNVTSPLETDEAGINPDSLGQDTLVVLAPPTIEKIFSPNPIAPNGVSTLTFILTNPNQDDAISGVQFSDTFPNTPGTMKVATPPNASWDTGCEDNAATPTFTPSANDTSISFSGAGIAGGGTCMVQVDVTADVVGDYDNTSDAVTHNINGSDEGTDIADDTLTVQAIPALTLTKQIGESATGPWFTSITVPPGTPVWYRFVVENSGNVDLTNIVVSDVSNTPVNTATCTWDNPLVVAATDECILGSVAAVEPGLTNTADALGVYNTVEYESNQSSAIYATTSLSMTKSVQESKLSQAGDVLHYSYLVENTGYAALAAPITIDDDKASDESCPDLTDGFLDIGETITCTATYTVQPGDIPNGVTNVATASSSDPGKVTSNRDSQFVPYQPTAANLATFRARNRDTNIIVRWRTTSEAQIAGFNVYRRVGKGEWAQINKTLRQAKHPGVAMDDRYRYIDRQVETGRNYYYKLQVLYLDNHTEWTNTIQVKR